MNLIIQKQEETIAQLQLAVEHYLESGDLETALIYSELFKLNCEVYKTLVGNTEVKEEKPAFKFGKQTAQRKPPVFNRTTSEEIIDYENQMRSQYNLANQNSQPARQRLAEGYAGKITEYVNIPPQQPVISQYSYGDGQDNPKIRANDANGNWGANGEPNEIITPPQQLINKYLVNAPGEDDNLWDDDPRRNVSSQTFTNTNNGFVPPVKLQ
jgi:hypothetical protein